MPSRRWQPQEKKTEARSSKISILVDENVHLLVQGITGNEGGFHTRRCIEYGTRVVAGVTPGRGGSDFDGIPVFNEVARAVRETGANTSMIFVPPPSAADAIIEAAAAQIPLVVCITEGIPTLDMITVRSYLSGKSTQLIGPNCPGVISPGKSKVGIMPADIYIHGEIGVISRSGTLMYEVVAQLSEQGIGQSTCVGIGGDSLIGTSFVDVLELFEKDKHTKAVVLIGEIGGSGEQQAAEFIKKSMSKPVVGLVVGKTAPPGRRMGHVGAVISGSAATAEAKITALQKAGVIIANSPGEVATKLREC